MGGKKRKKAVAAYERWQHVASLAAAHIELVVRPSGLSMSQFGVLDTIIERGAVHQQELAEAVGLSKGQMTAVINSLESPDLVRRERHPDDKRYVSVFLTDAGRALHKKVAPDRIDAIVAAMNVLSPKQRKRLTRICARVERSFLPAANPSSLETDELDVEPQAADEVGPRSSESVNISQST